MLAFRENLGFAWECGHERHYLLLEDRPEDRTTWHYEPIPRDVVTCDHSIAYGEVPCFSACARTSLKELSLTEKRERKDAVWCTTER